MDYKSAYHHLFNRVSALISLLEAPEEGREAINLPAYLKQAQMECEEICIATPPRPGRAPRRGGSNL